MLIEFAKSVVLITSALFPIVNPLGSSPIFLSLTREYAVSTRRVLARKVAFNSFILLVASFLVGSHILTFFGISIPVVQVGGGLIVISTGWTLLSKKDEQERHANGPRHFGASLLSIIAAVVGSAVMALMVYLCYGFADRLAAILGENGMTIVMRLSSFLLVCIGVQILWNGLSALLQNLAHSLPAISR